MQKSKSRGSLFSQPPKFKSCFLISHFFMKQTKNATSAAEELNEIKQDLTSANSLFLASCISSQNKHVKGEIRPPEAVLIPLTPFMTP